MADMAPLALTMGDPAGVGPLISWRAWANRQELAAPFCLIADRSIMETAREHARVDGDIVSISDISEAGDAFARGLPLLQLDCPHTSPGSPLADTAPAIIQSIETAVSLVHQGRASAVVTNPIAKALLYAQGFAFPGHTEFLAELAKRHHALAAAPRPVMMLVGGGLRVALATIHQSLRSVPDALSQPLLEEIGDIVHASLLRDFGMPAPRIALCGLNPHAGEDGSLGREEIEIINPAAAALRARGAQVSDAQPGDTVFHAMLEGQYDAVIAMYHDQGLIPVKTLDIWGGVNVTLGLPFIRTSPDHGTGYAAARDASARPDSLVAALNLAAHMAKARANA